MNTRNSIIVLLLIVGVAMTGTAAAEPAPVITDVTPMWGCYAIGDTVVVTVTVEDCLSDLNNMTVTADLSTFGVVGLVNLTAPRATGNDTDATYSGDAEVTMTTSTKCGISYTTFPVTASYDYDPWWGGPREAEDTGIGAMSIAPSAAPIVTSVTTDGGCYVVGDTVTVTADVEDRNVDLKKMDVTADLSAFGAGSSVILTLTGKPTKISTKWFNATYSGSAVVTQKTTNKNKCRKIKNHEEFIVTAVDKGNHVGTGIGQMDVMPNPCYGVSCEGITQCVGYDRYNMICVDGCCVKNEIIEENSVCCGYDPCEDTDCTGITQCVGYDLYNTVCDGGQCVPSTIKVTNCPNCGERYDPCGGKLCDGLVCVGYDLYSMYCDQGECKPYQWYEKNSAQCGYVAPTPTPTPTPEPTPAPTPEEVCPDCPEHIPGDVNGDGKVNIGDGLLLFNWIAYPNERGTTYVLK